LWRDSLDAGKSVISAQVADLINGDIISIVLPDEGIFRLTNFTLKCCKTKVIQRLQDFKYGFQLVWIRLSLFILKRIRHNISVLHEW